MAGENIGKILKLFCTAESGGAYIEPSWKSWLVFSLLLLASILLTASGVYFQLRLVYISAIFCFLLSVAGFVMTAATLLAILLGYSRRRRCRVSDRNVGVSINDERPTIAGKSVWLNIENDLIASYRNAEFKRQWSNPVYADSDSSLYETELKQFESEDFKKRDFNIADGSSITRACSDYGSPEDDALDRIPSEEESDLSEVGEIHIENQQDCGWMLEQKSSRSGGAETPGMDSRPTASISHQESNLDPYQVYLHHRMTSIDSMPHQESNLDQYQVYLHYKMTSIPISEMRNRRHLSSKNFEDETVLNGNSATGEDESVFHGNVDNSGGCLHSYSVKQSNPAEGGGVQLHPTERQNAHVSLAPGVCKHPTDYNLKHDCHVNVKNRNDFFPPKLPMEFQGEQLTSLEHEKDNHLTVVSMQNDYQSIAEQHNSSYLAKLHEECQNNNRNSMLRQDNQHTVINIDDDVQHHGPSRHALNFQDGFKSFRYPDSEWSEYGDREHWKWYDRNDYMRPIINKRPLLNPDGEPISQYEFVKVLRKLLQKGLQQFPKYPVE